VAHCSQSHPEPQELTNDHLRRRIRGVRRLLACGILSVIALIAM
jgi:hypothetical protein